MEQIELNSLEQFLDSEDKLCENIEKRSFGQYLASLTDDEMYDSFSKYGVSREKAQSWIRDSKLIRMRAKKGYNF